MVELADRVADAASKIRNLDDYDRRVERAARRVDENDRARGEAAFVIYESILAKSGRPLEEIQELMDKFQTQFEDEDEPFTLARTSAILNVEGNEWFFGDDELRIMTGRLLGQFQHRVAQYNYVNEREVVRRWADSHDTRLFIRRRIYETEPVVGVVAGLDLKLVQYLRVAAGGNTLVPTEEVAHALNSLGFDETGDEYEVLAVAENLALHLNLPAPVVGELLQDIARDGSGGLPEPSEESQEVEGEPSDTGTGEDEITPEFSDGASRPPEEDRQDPQ